MTNRELFHNIMNRKSDKCGFWHGCPNEASIDKLYNYFDVKDDFELGLKLNSTFRWIMPEQHGMWKHPEAAAMFDALGGLERHSLGQDGVFANCEDVAEVERFPWPDVSYCDFTETMAEIDKTIAVGQAVVSGTWSCFYHNAADFFGMENYFVKMHTDPAVVEAVTEHIVDFYLEANEKLFDIAGDKIDAFFFGNDFGSQLDLLISPAMFEKFIMPYFVKFTQQAKRRGYKVLLHSCGAIDKAIPYLIDAGVDALHPIQAKAANMNAEHLSSKYNGKIVFVGGVDTQDLLPFHTAQEVRDNVRRIKELFGTNFIASPSHESILPNVPPENIVAMMEEAVGG